MLLRTIIIRTILKILKRGPENWVRQPPKNAHGFFLTNGMYMYHTSYEILPSTRAIKRVVVRLIPRIS